MGYRMDRGRPAARSARREREWARSLVALGVAGALAGVWACVPRVPAGSPAPAQPVPSQGFVAVASARPLAPSAPAVPLTVAPDLERELRESVQREERAAEAFRSERTPAFRIEAEHEMLSTMYCLKGNTRTGVRTRDGIAAADPAFLPLGSVVRLSHPDGRALGVFVVMDTGGAVKGRKIDIYVDDCGEASRWGVRRVMAEVLDLGRVAG